MTGRITRPWNVLPAARLGAAAAALAMLGGCVVAPVGHPYRTRPAPPPPPAPVASAPMFFYPERGQSAELQDRDRYECYRWAVRETGFDPGMTPTMQPPRVAGPPQVPPAADVVAGAATGAVIGAAVSSPRHAGSNAIIGAIFGAALGAAANESRQRAADVAAARNAEMDARARMPMDGFRRAMSACMGGRGYRVE